MHQKFDCHWPQNNDFLPMQYQALNQRWPIVNLPLGNKLRARHWGMPACPGHVDLVPGHLNFCSYVPNWASDFSVWACTYFPSSIHKLYRACTNIGWAHKNFCRTCKFSEPRARRACKPNALKCQALKLKWNFNQYMRCLCHCKCFYKIMSSGPFY